MHEQVLTNDVNKWSRDFLDRLGGRTRRQRSRPEDARQSAFMDTDDDRERREDEHAEQAEQAEQARRAEQLRLADD